MDRLKALFATARSRVPGLDHLIRAGGRYQADTGDRLAAGITYFFFLSIFPILLLTVSILGYVYGDQAPMKVTNALSNSLGPELTTQISDVLTNSKRAVGIVGIVGLLYAGLGFVDALRNGIRTIWHQNVQAGNFLVKKLRDSLTLIGLLGTIFGSVLVTGFLTGFTGTLLSYLSIDNTAPARLFTRLLSYAATLVLDLALFSYLFSRLPKVRAQFPRVLKPALFGAVGFELLKSIGGIYVARTTSNQATYGAFAVVVGLLLFLYLLSRLILFTAAFAVTAKGDSDVAPSGTADLVSAKKAGIPAAFVSGDPDDPPNLTEDGAPSPLRAHINGSTPSQDVETDVGPVQAAAPLASARRGPAQGGTSGRSEQAHRAPGASDQEGVTAVALPTEKQVVLAARATTVAGGAVVAAVGLHTLRTVVRIVRR